MKYVLRGMLMLLVMSVGSCIAHESEKEKDANDLFYPILSDTYVIRWAFQDLCDHVFDPRKVWPTTTKAGGASFDPSVVRAGDTILVRYLQEMHA